MFIPALSESQNKDFSKFMIGEKPLDSVVNWIKDNLDPEDIFSTTQLDKWAESEGYIKPDNQ